MLKSNALASGKTLDSNGHTKAGSNERCSVADENCDARVVDESSSRGRRPSHMIVSSDSSEAESNHDYSDQDAKGGHEAASEANAYGVGRTDDSLLQPVLDSLDPSAAAAAALAVAAFANRPSSPAPPVSPQAAPAAAAAASSNPFAAAFASIAPYWNT